MPLSKESFLIFLRGICMGIADVIPGVSGGTIAFITGIYQRLISSLSKIDLSFMPLFVQGRWKRSWSVIKKIDFALFIPLGLGVILSIFFFSKLIKLFLENNPAMTFAFFFGLILSSALIFIKKLGKKEFEKIVFVVLGFIFAYSLSEATALGNNHSLLIVFFSGALAICAMLLPGISGAFILLLLGQYQFLIDSLHSYEVFVLLTFFAGAISGLVTFSKVVNFFLRKFKFLTLAFLVGLMVGSLRVPMIEISNNGGVGLMVFLFGLLGFFLIFLLEKVFAKKK